MRPSDSARPSRRLVAQPHLLAPSPALSGRGARVPRLALGLALLLTLGACSQAPADAPDEPPVEAADAGEGQVTGEGAEDGGEGVAPAGGDVDGAPAAPSTARPEPTEDTRFEPVGFEPMPEAECQAIADLLSGVLGPDVGVAGMPTVPFVDYATQEAGQGCLSAATFDGTQVDAASMGSAPQEAIVEGVLSAFTAAGWAEDAAFAADPTSRDGAGGAAAGFRRGDDLCLLSFSWTEQADPADSTYSVSANCARQNT